MRNQVRVERCYSFLRYQLHIRAPSISYDKGCLHMYIYDRRRTAFMFHSASKIWDSYEQQLGRFSGSSKSVKNVLFFQKKKKIKVIGINNKYCSMACMTVAHLSLISKDLSAHRQGPYLPCRIVLTRYRHHTAPVPIAHPKTLYFLN